MPPITIEHFGSLMLRTNVEQKKAFGMPALFVNGNMFLSIMPEGVSFKLDEAGAQQSQAYAGVKPVQMKGWIELPFSAEADWLMLAEAAFKYVSTLPPKARKK